MSSTPREVGTLIAVILKAKNLPNKRHIGKQDPYCVVILNGEKRRTRAIKRGGQHPEWDQEVRFTLYEDVEDELARTTSNSDVPPTPPPKEERKIRKIKGGKAMLISCWDDAKEPDLIGEGVVDLTEVLTKGETDEWFTITSKDKYCGEVYLELTFWSNEKPPEKKPGRKSIRLPKQYGGPGSFVAADERQESLRNVGSAPPSLRPSSSLATLDLYTPIYETQAKNKEYRAIDRVIDEFGSLEIDGIKRRGSFPPTYMSHASRPPSDISISSLHSLPAHYPHDYAPYNGANPSNYPYDRPETPNMHPTFPRPSFPYATPLHSQTEPVYYNTYEVEQFNGDPEGQQYMNDYSRYDSTTPTPSGFIPAPHAPTSSGFVLQNSQPEPSGFPAPSAVSSSRSYHSQSSLTTTLPSFAPALPPPTTANYTSQAPGTSVMQSHSYHNYSQPPVLLQSQPYTINSQISNAQPQVHSAPPVLQYMNSSQPTPSNYQVYNSAQYSNQTATTPSPPHTSVLPQQYNPSPPVHPGSRPLPQPGQQQTLPPHSVAMNGQLHISATSASYHSGLPYVSMPNPPPPPPLNTGQPQYQADEQVSHPIPPPPPPQLASPIRTFTQPSLSSHSQYQIPSESSKSHIALPQPPINYSPSIPSSISSVTFNPPPPPPPLPQASQSQHPTPQSYGQSDLHFPGPPPRPPLEYSANSFV